MTTLPGQDCTEQKGLLDVLGLRNEAFQVLTKFIRSEFRMDEALDHILDRIIAFFQARAGSIMLADPSGQNLNFSVVRGDKSGHLKDLKVRRGEGIAGKVLETGESLIVNDTDRSDEFDSGMAGTIGYVPRRILCVPLKVKDNTYGVIEVMDRPQDPFTRNDESLLLSIAEPIAVMLENIALFQSKEEDIKSLRTLMQVNQFINTTIELHALLTYIMNAAKTLLNSEGSSLLLIDEATQELFFNVVELDAVGNKESLKEIRLPIGVGIAGLVAKNGEPLIVNDAPNDRRVFRKADEMTSFKTRNILAVPMKVQNKIIGVLQVVNSLGRAAYSDSDLKLLGSMAEQAGIAVHNRGLINNLQKANVQLERKIRELTAINKVSRFISRNLDYNIQEILAKIIRILSETLAVERVSVFLHDEEQDVLRVVNAMGIRSEHFTEIAQPVSGKILGHVFRTGNSVLVEDLGQHPEFGRFKRFRYKTRSFVSVPLRIKNKIVGVLNLSDKADGQPFRRDDLEIIETISIQIGESYENALFYREVLDKQRMEKELEVANAIQQHILSREFLTNDSLDIVATSLPASEIGGDFYDCVRIAQDQYAIYIADVSGKGVPAALFMALSHSIMKVVSLNAREPGPVLEQANRFIISDSKNGMFVTLFYLFLDTSRKTLRYACAGHNEQIYYDNQKDEIRLVKTRGVPLGVSADAAYPSGEVAFRPGDFIVLFTDGVVEAQDNQNNQYGLERLQEVVLKSKRLPAVDILAAVRSDVERFCGGARQFDDLTLFVVKFK
jgi:sigma-B regulation protein RsbU (phosphoserine phosphatase)